MNTQTSPTVNTVYYANVYEVGREFGGAEEGGSYYDAWTYLNVVAVGLDEATVEQKATEYRMQLIADRTEEKGVYHMGHGPHDGADPDGNGDDAYLLRGGRWGRDKIEVRVQDHPGKDGNNYRPYE